MRQLFSCISDKSDDDGRNVTAILVGLDNRAFLVVNKGASSHKTTSQQQQQRMVAAVVVELLPPDVPTSSSSSQEPANHEVCAVSMIQSSSSTAIPDENQRQEFICVVARSDKTLSVYPISSSSPTTVQSTISYRTPKRVTSLTFGTLPTDTKDALSSSSASSSSSSLESSPVVVAGDVVGDAYAYSLDSSNKGRRLLLGHTASMLTGVQIVSSSIATTTTDADDGYDDGAEESGTSMHQLLLTSDRDEKIRISHWPETYKIHGYLLGHTEYVSAFDVAAAAGTTTTTTTTSKDRLLAVSCGGDLTIRLWDVFTQQQLCVTDIDQQRQEQEQQRDGDGDGDGEQQESLQQQDEDNSDDKGNKDNDAQMSSSKAAKIPTDISINKSGTLVAVIFDQSCEMDVYKIVATTESTSSSSCSLSKVCSTTFPCQPLSIDFVDDNDTLLAVTQDPNYIVGYQIHNDGIEEAKEYTLSDQTDFDGCLDELRKCATSLNIRMPSTILEKDESGNPKVQRASETRGPSGALPWNRVERVAPVKERYSRKTKNKKRRKKTERSEHQSADENDEYEDDEKQVEKKAKVNN